MLNTLNIQKITTKRDCFNEQELLSYVQGKCDKQLRFDIENHLLDCEICSDVVEGFQILEKQGNTENYLTEVKAQKEQLFTEKNRSQKVLWLSIAAMFILALGSYWFFSQQASEIKQQEFAQRFEEKKPESTETKKLEAPTQETAESNTITKDKEELKNAPKKQGAKALSADEPADASRSEKEASPALAEEKFYSTSTGSASSVAKNDKSIDANLTYSVPPLEQSNTAVTEDLKSSSGEIMMDDIEVSNKEVVARKKSEEDKDSKKSKNKQEKVATNTNRSVAAAPTSKDESGGAVAGYNSESPISEGMKLYNAKKYTDAADLFTQIYYGKNSMEAAYYAALSHFKLKNYTSALSFTNIVIQAKKEWYQEAQWLNYEIYTAQNNTNEAKKILEKISAEKGKFAGKANQELEKLK